MDSIKSTVKSVHKVRKSSVRKQWKWPEDKPRRPKSAYNYFFRQERQKLLHEMPSKSKCPTNTVKSRKSNGLGFSALAKTIAAKWKLLNEQDKAEFQARADKDTVRYQHEIAAWQKKNQENKQCVTGSALNQSESVILNNTNSFAKTLESLESMSELIEQSITALQASIMASQQQMLLLSAQQDMGCISHEAPPVLSDEITDGAFVWEQHPSSMSLQETSSSLQELQEEESCLIGRSKTESPISAFEDILDFPDNDVRMDDDISALFEELDSF